MGYGLWVRNQNCVVLFFSGLICEKMVNYNCNPTGLKNKQNRIIKEDERDRKMRSHMGLAVEPMLML